MERKPDADEIVAHLSSLPKLLDSSRKWWPKCLLHSAHIENAASILNDGVLLPRSRAVSEGRLVQDSASPGLIGDLPGGLKSLVRLYFSPRTPTQYRNQGIRPKAEYYEGKAHMPVPVYLVFDAREVLTRESTGYTTGRLEHRDQIGRDAEAFRSIAFEDVYHDWGVPQDRREILNHRNSEVLVPEELDLDPLRLVVCRSQPELDTLAHLLSPDALKRWQGKMMLEQGRRFFETKISTYLEEVQLSSEHMSFRFYTGMQDPEKWCGPYRVEVRCESPEGTKTRTLEGVDVSERTLTWRLNPPRPAYRASLFVDDCLVYQREWREPGAGAQLLKAPRRR